MSACYVLDRTIKKSQARLTLNSSPSKVDNELGGLIQEVEDSNVHDRHRGAAIVLRVCLEHLTCIRTLRMAPSEVKVNLAICSDLINHLGNIGKTTELIIDCEKAYNEIMNLGDTAAHYELRDPTRRILATRATIDHAIGQLDILSRIVGV